jgi:phage gp36-like protein
MGRYTTWDQVVGRYQSAKTGIDASYANSYFVKGAEDLLDGYLASRYSVPFSPAPGVIQDLATDMAYYKLVYAEKRGEPLKKSIDERIKAILDGTIMLVSSGSLLPNASQETGIVDDRPSAFGPDDPINWTPSSSWAQEYQAERE